MIKLTNQKLNLLAGTAVLVLTVVSGARAAEGDTERSRVASYYNSCYRSCCGKPTACELWGYAHPCECEHPSLCERCCCARYVGSLFWPGGPPPTRFVDHSLYRAAWPMSPWYSHPRDGIIYPAYGSKSPNCLSGAN